APFESPVELAFDFKPFARSGVHRAGEALKTVPSKVLGLVHGHIGMLLQRAGVLAILRKQAETDTGAGEQLVPFYLEWRPHGLRDPASDDFRIAHRLDAEQHRHEF